MAATIRKIIAYPKCKIPITFDDLPDPRTIDETIALIKNTNGLNPTISGNILKNTNSIGKSAESPEPESPEPSDSEVKSDNYLSQLPSSQIQKQILRGRICMARTMTLRLELLQSTELCFSVFLELRKPLVAERPSSVEQVAAKTAALVELFAHTE